MTTNIKIGCFFATSGHSGVDRVVKNLLPEFAAMGVQVQLLQIKHHGPYFEADAFDQIERIAFNASHVLTALPELVRYFKTEKPDAFLCDKDKVNRTVLWAKWLAGVDTKVSVRSGTTMSVMLESWGKWQRLVQTFSVNYLYKNAHKVLVPAQSNKDDLLAHFKLQDADVSVVPSPILSNEFYHKLQQPLDHEWFTETAVPVILGVGELSPRKDFATLIKAFAKVRQNRECRLVILGRGKQQQKLVDLAAELQVGNDVALLGFQANPYQYMSRSHVFALTSHFEGMPVALIEALGAGANVVSTDSPGGSRELLQNGKFGQLVGVANADELAVALTAALDAPRGQTPKPIQDRYSANNSAQCYLRAMGVLAD